MLRSERGFCVCEVSQVIWVGPVKYLMFLFLSVFGLVGCGDPAPVDHSEDEDQAVNISDEEISDEQSIEAPDAGGDSASP